MKDNPRKDSGGYTFILLLITIIFLGVSLALMFKTKTEWKDVYAAACSIAGGVIGGIITLEGVKRTVLAQKEQESLKLIPHKLVALHKLTMKKEEVLTEMYNDTKGLRQGFYKSLSKNYSDENIKNFVEAYFKMDKYRDHTLKEKEYELIQIASQIDIETYKEIISLFEELRHEFAMFYVENSMMLFGLAIDNLSNLSDEDFVPDLPDDFNYEDFKDSLFLLTKQLQKISSMLLQQQGKFLKDNINLKLEQYGKEML